jgi:hypothetical protein
MRRIANKFLWKQPVARGMGQGAFAPVALKIFALAPKIGYENKKHNDKQGLIPWNFTQKNER